jgi:diacylglycerol kinase (ATP)
MLSYYAPTARAFFAYRFPRMRIFVDGKPADEASTFTLISNTRRYGGPFVFFRDARPDDGKLDVCCLHGRHWLDLVRYGWKALRKTLWACPDALFFQGTRVRIESDEPVAVQIDGDPGGALPLDVTLLPGAVDFCVP